MLYYVHDQGEESLSKVCVLLKVVLNVDHCAGAETLIDNGELVNELVTHMLHHRGEEVEYFRVARILRIRLEVVNQQFQRGQELRVKDRV